jgi:hypothetical protein
VQRELPTVLSADDAKTLVQQMLARQWSARDRLTLRLPPARLGLEPGSIVNLALTPRLWLVDKCTIDSFVAVVELRPSWQPSAALIAESGRIVSNSDVIAAPTSLALIEAPNVTDTQTSGSTVLIAASSPNAGWGSRTLTVSGSGQTFVTQTAARKSVLGRALTVLANADPFLIDEVNSVDVELVDQQQWITSCDEDALTEGMNLAVLGSELVQFADVLPLGHGRFRLANLLRGRGGTEWAASIHSVDEPFCLLDSNSLRLLPLPVWMRGSAVTVSDQSGSSASFIFGAESVRPLSPYNLSASFDAGGDLMLSWTRRSRAGFAWLDEIDAPVGESREQYRVTITATAASLELTAEEPFATVAALDLAPLGGGPATVEVRQLGDWAASRPAQLTIQIL